MIRSRVGKDHPFERTEHTFIRVDNFLILFGGMERKKIYNDVKIFDPGTLHLLIY